MFTLYLSKFKQKLYHLVFTIYLDQKDKRLKMIFDDSIDYLLKKTNLISGSEFWYDNKKSYGSFFVIFRKKDRYDFFDDLSILCMMMCVVQYFFFVDRPNFPIFFTCVNLPAPQWYFWRILSLFHIFMLKKLVKWTKYDIL